jgi:hypothetical protein
MGAYSDKIYYFCGVSRRNTGARNQESGVRSKDKTGNKYIETNRLKIQVYLKKYKYFYGFSCMFEKNIVHLRRILIEGM